jgi:hypothetical protein
MPFRRRKTRFSRADRYSRAARIAGIFYFGLSLLLLVAIRTPRYAENPIAFGDTLYLGPVAVAGTAFIILKFKTYFYPKYGAVAVWINALLICVFGVLFLFPYQIAFNALAGPGTPITFSGPIIAKHRDGGKSVSYDVEILDSISQRNMSFTVGLDYFNRAQLGDTYQETFRMGRLGIPYRWRWQEP